MKEWTMTQKQVGRGVLGRNLVMVGAAEQKVVFSELVLKPLERPYRGELFDPLLHAGWNLLSDFLRRKHAAPLSKLELAGMSYLDRKERALGEHTQPFVPGSGNRAIRRAAEVFGLELVADRASVKWRKNRKI